VSCSVELPCSHPVNPRDTRNQRSIDSLLQATRVHLSITRAPPCGSATCPSSCLGSRHFTTSAVETRSSQPPNLQMRDTRDEALIQRSSATWILWLSPLLTTSPLATWSTQPLGSHLANLRVHEACTQTSSTLRRPHDCCHLSSSDGRS
jgi:hypothetical protein